MVASMDRWRGKIAVVTGASAGIGAAIAELLVNEGLKVVGLARRKEKLEELAKSLENKPGKFYPFKADVSKEEDILAAFKWTKDNLGPVHILINNAGIMRITNLTEGDTEMWKETFDVNVLAPCIATREAVRDMRANKVDGHVLFLNSIAGHKVPNYADVNVEPASKHALTALVETLRQELNSIGSKIRVTSISPGAVRSEGAMSEEVLSSPEIAEFLRTAPMLKTTDIAEAIAYVLSTPPHVQIHELMIKPVGEAI